jgi:3-(3-hydroxy-phenyl)propionate hydroxylase
VSESYSKPIFPYRRHPDQDARTPVRHRVVIVGAGPVGLTLAIDLRLHGIDAVIIDDNNTVSEGSRAICHSKRTLEILDRLGCGDAVADRGVRWNVGKVFFQDHLVYSFDLLPEPGHRRPAFVNLQQYHLELALLRRLQELGGAVRWKNRLSGVAVHADGTTIDIATPEGDYRLECDYLIAADGVRSATRGLMGLESKGQMFQDRFLIADVLMKADFPTERWFWFDPPFHRNQSALLHRQADNVWRIDFQLGWDADPEVEKQPPQVSARIRAMLGEDAEFELEWVSVYTFQCRRMDKFRHGRVLFAGDAAHQVSPFGARGGNGGIQDSENLAWKLALVLTGQAPDSLLDSYDAERGPAADENIIHSTRSTDFITPKSAVSRRFRDATLLLAETCPFARRLVNSGRLSLPCMLSDSPLNTPDGDAFSSPMAPGAPCADAPLKRGGRPQWLLDYLGGDFAALYFGDLGDPAAAPIEAVLKALPVVVRLVAVKLLSGASDGEALQDVEGCARQRYDAREGTLYLIRPDQHVAARFRAFDGERLRAAVARTLAFPP